MKSLVVFSVALAMAGSLSVSADDIVLGSRVRIAVVDASGGRLVGRVIGLDAQSITVDGAQRRVVVPRSSILRLEVSRGRRSRWGRAAAGLLLGAAAGYLVGSLTESDDHGAPCVDDPWCTYFSSSSLFDMDGLAAAGGAMIGAPVGALLGAVTGGERWHAVEPVALAMTRTPHGRGIGAAVTLRF